MLYLILFILIYFVFLEILGELDRKNDLKSVKQARRLYRTCLNTGKRIIA